MTLELTLSKRTITGTITFERMIGFAIGYVSNSIGIILPFMVIEIKHYKQETDKLPTL